MDKRFIKMDRANSLIPIDPEIRFSLNEVELDFGEEPTSMFIEAMKEVYHVSKKLDFYYVYEDGDNFYGYIVERDQTATPFILKYISKPNEEYYEFIRFDDQKKLKVFESSSFDFESAYEIIKESE